MARFVIFVGLALLCLLSAFVHVASSQDSSSSSSSSSNTFPTSLPFAATSSLPTGAEHLHNTRVWLIGDSFARQLYGGILGTLSATPPILEIEREHRHSDFDATIGADTVVSYRFVDFASNLTRVLGNALGCSRCFGYQPQNDPEALALLHTNTENSESVAAQSRINTSIVVVSVGLWDLLWNEPAAFVSGLAQTKHALQTCLSPQGTCAKPDHDQPKYNAGRILVRQITPVVENKLPGHKLTMTNDRISRLNEVLRTAFPDKIDPTCIHNNAATLAVHSDSHIQSYLGAESSDGVHYSSEALLKDVRTTLHEVAALTLCAATHASPHSQITTQHEKRGGKDGAVSKGDAEPKGPQALDKPPPKGVHAAHSERMPPCHSLECLSVTQIGLVLVYALTLCALLIAKAWRYFGSAHKTSDTTDTESAQPILEQFMSALAPQRLIPAIAAREQLLQQWFILGLILLLMWLVDGPNKVLLGHQEKVYDRDLYAFVCIVILLVCFLFIENTTPAPSARPAASPKPAPVAPPASEGSETKDLKEKEKETDVEQGAAPIVEAPKPEPTIELGSSEILNRQQTEEWKGWMQIMFLLYHYYNAKEVYNAIRLFIAAYVWMTGYGHVFYCTGRKAPDMGVVRLSKMLFRLNFLVTLMCITMQNDYMLYYICALHTLVFLLTYLSMLAFRKYNLVSVVIQSKFVLLFVLAYFLWDYSNGALFYLIFTPFAGFFTLNDSLYEFYFRTNLDHYIWIWGMVCAYYYPSVERFFVNLETKKSYQTQMLVKAGLTGVALAITVWYTYQYLMIEDKFAYNDVHPYTSFIPVTLYIFFRNITPGLRSKHLSMLSWMGKSTLETYLLQFHLFLTSSSKTQIVYIPDYPNLNFLVTCAVFLYLSITVYHITTTVSDFCISYRHTPTDLARRISIGSVVWIFICILAFLTRVVFASTPLGVFIGALLAVISVTVLGFFFLYIKT